MKRCEEDKRDTIDGIKHHRPPQQRLRLSHKDPNVEEQKRHLHQRNLRKVKILQQPEVE